MDEGIASKREKANVSMSEEIKKEHLSKTLRDGSEETT
jgi:hypothetical protein